MRFGVCLGITWCFMGAGLNAQNTMDQQLNGWTLKQCIDYATEHNINVRQKVLEKQNQELNVQTAQYSRLPDLNVGMGQNFYFGRGPGRDGTYQDQTQASASLNASTNIPVFSGLRIYHQVKANQLNLQAAIEDLNQAKEDLALNITSYYLQVLLNKEIYEISLEHVRLNEEQVKNTEILVHGGKSPESELYDAKAALAREVVNQTQAWNSFQLSLLDLSQLLNLPAVEDFELTKPDVEHMVVPEGGYLMLPDAVYSASVGQRPVIRAAQLRLQSSERNLKISQSAYYPTLSLGASYSNGFYHTYRLEEGGNTPFLRQMNRNGSESVGLNLSIPVFSRLSTRNQVKGARLAIENQQLELEDLKQNLHKEIQKAYYNAVASHEKYISSEKSAEASQVAFDYELQKYKAGRSTSYQFNDMKTRLAKSLSEAVQAKYNFIFQTKILDFYIGKPLYE